LAKHLKNSNNDSFEQSDSVSSEEKSTDGQLIHLNIYLGRVRGQVSLSTLSSEDPAKIAHDFCRTHKLPSIELELEIKERLREKMA